MKEVDWECEMHFALTLGRQSHCHRCTIDVIVDHLRYETSPTAIRQLLNITIKIFLQSRTL